MFKRQHQPKQPDTYWYSRGYVLHFNSPIAIQSLTMRLIDAVPLQKVRDWKLELEISTATPLSDPRRIELQRRIAKYEDRGFGCCLLRKAEAAKIVEDALLYFDSTRYNLYAWCIMPNHVHVLFEPTNGYEPMAVAASWKSYTANQLQRKRLIAGEVWERDGFDRYIRNEEHFNNALQYIENNPVKASLAKRAEDWKFSSAYRRFTQEAGTEAGAPSKDSL